LWAVVVAGVAQVKMSTQQPAKTELHRASSRVMNSELTI
jgi:hypothetical protein